MSNYYSSYNQYLGAQRCCNIKSQGPVGPKGPVGPASIGPIGKTGATGAIGYTGSTGIQGPTGDNSGYTGATGLRGNAGVVIQYIYKNTDFTDSVNFEPSDVYPFNGLPTLSCYSTSSSGYVCSITPQSSESKIKVQFKVQYQASDTFSTKLTLGVVCTSDNGNTYSLVGQDVFCGTVNASGPLTNTYTFNYMHSPSTTNTTTYQMFYQLQGSSSNSLGIINSSANCIILEEYLGSGSANQGSTGATGPTGLIGYTGPTGAIGTGVTGYTGAPGNPGVVIQYKYKNNGFVDNSLKYTPSTISPYVGLSELFCYNAGSILEGSYKESITPQSSDSSIKVQFKVQYQASDTDSTKLTLGVVYQIEGDTSYILLGQDEFCGTVNASGPLTSTYTFNFMHNPGTTSSITYSMFYQLQGNSTNALGIVKSSANCIILEEYLGSGSANQGSRGATGPTGSSEWLSIYSTAIHHDGNVYIDGTLDVSGGNIITSTPYGVTYNYYKSYISSSEIDYTYAYQIILCNSGPIILPISGFASGDWITIVNLDSAPLYVHQNTSQHNLIYTINSTSTGAANSAKFIFYSSGYSYNNNTYYWIIGS